MNNRMNAVLAPHVMILTGPVHRSNEPKLSLNQCMNARFQVAENKFNDKEETPAQINLLLVEHYELFLQSPN